VARIPKLSIKVDIISPGGNRRSFESTENLAARTAFGIEKAFYFVGKTLVSEFNRQVLAKDKTGRIYIRRTRSGAKRRHRASAPGETPANRTGNYRRGIGFRVQGSKQLVFGNEVEYAGFLEIGTSRMGARPGLSNAIVASERSIIRNLADEIEDQL